MEFSIAMFDYRSACGTPAPDDPIQGWKWLEHGHRLLGSAVEAINE